MPIAPRRLAAAALLAATLGVYAPYATNRLVSGNPDGDGATYLIVLADACEQARAGVFPVYAGQSALRFNGGVYPQAQAPLLTLVGPALDLLTGRRLHATTLMNLIVLLAALAGALAMHAVLLRLAPASPWAAAALAFAYVACPGVLGVLVRLDMLTSFLTLPLLPWLWHALLRAWQGDEARAGVTLGLTLALLGAAHPPVALWATTAAAVVGLTGLALFRCGVKTAALGAGVFAAAFAWPLTTLFALTGGTAANVGWGTDGGRLSPETVARTLASVRGDFPGALLPVGWVRGHPVAGWPTARPAFPLVPPSWSDGAVLPYLQLGWMLWAALGLGCVTAVFALTRRAPDRRLVALLAGALFVAAFLLPLPWLTAQLWALLPGAFNVTKWWPMQRLYLVLASLAAPAGMLAWSATTRRHPRARALAAALCLLPVWSALEAAKFTRLGFDGRARGPEAARLENVRLHAKDLQSGAARVLPEYTDPLLHFRVVDAAGRARLDNRAAARAACARARPLETLPDDATLARVTLDPLRHTLLCTKGPRAGLLEAYAPGFYRHLVAGGPRDGGLLPLFTTQGAPLSVNVRLIDAAGRRAPLDDGSVGVTSYDPRALPVRVASWIPLRAEVEIEGLDAPLWLETSRQHVAGYRARVDGRDAPVVRSADGLAAVALPPGRHTVELAHAGPPAARAAFPLSLAAWLLGAARLARPRRRAPGIG
jgi:hypothetical protein